MTKDNVQEPVAWMDKYGEIYKEVDDVLSTDTPLYTAPPAHPAPVQNIEHCIWARNGNTPCPHTTQPAQRQWVGLTQEEQRECFQKMFDAEASWPIYANAIEAKLREKNT